MTFIASVIAKRGVAIIADSLVTSSLPILHYKSFLEHLSIQPKTATGDISLNPADIEKLFDYEPFYTKDFEEKIFKLNKYTAITTTGVAQINGKKIIDLVDEFIGTRADIENLTISIDDRIQQFSDYLTTQIKEHLAKNEEIGTCILLFTFYETTSHTTHIYRLATQEADKTALADKDFKYFTLFKEPMWLKVVCDGQNKLSDNILYGMSKTLYNIFPKIVENILNKLTLPDGTVPPDFLKNLYEDEYFKNIFINDLEIVNLSDLSLQQAVDLASLLMRLEVDFQKYTKDLPTVGGVIKLAIIDERGFQFISGHDVIAPKHIIL